jgi:hypothetical protein
MQSGQLRIGSGSVTRKWAVHLAAVTAAVVVLTMANWFSGGSIGKTTVIEQSSNFLSSGFPYREPGVGRVQQDLEPVAVMSTAQVAVVPYPSFSMDGGFVPMLRSTSNQSWDRWESELAALESEIANAENGHNQETKISSIFPLLDPWSAEIEELSTELDEADGR